MGFLINIKTCLIIWAWVVKINTVVNDSVCSFILYRWMPISHCLDQSTVIFMESAIWNIQKAMCRLGLALARAVVFHLGVHTFYTARERLYAASLAWLNSVDLQFLNQQAHPSLIRCPLFQNIMGCRLFTSAALQWSWKSRIEIKSILGWLIGECLDIGVWSASLVASILIQWIVFIYF